MASVQIQVADPNGLSGSVIQQINHGLSTGALFLNHRRALRARHTRLISEFGGLSTPMPNFAAIYMIATLSSLGLPLLNGFIGEFVILRARMKSTSSTWRGPLSALFWELLPSVALPARDVWSGHEPANEHLPDLNAREYATLLPLIILCFWIGIYPKPLFRVLERPVQLIVEQVNPDTTGGARSCARNKCRSDSWRNQHTMPAMDMSGINRPPIRHRTTSRSALGRPECER